MPTFPTLKSDIETNMTLAILADERQNVQYARQGLASAYFVATVCKTVLLLADSLEMSGPDRKFYSEKLEQAERRVQSFWEDYKLVPHQVQDILPARSENGNGNGNGNGHAAVTRKPRVFLTDEQKAEVRTLAKERPYGRSVQDWYEEIAQTYGVHRTTVYRITEDE